MVRAGGRRHGGDHGPRVAGRVVVVVAAAAVPRRAPELAPALPIRQPHVLHDGFVAGFIPKDLPKPGRCTPIVDRRGGRVRVGERGQGGQLVAAPFAPRVREGQRRHGEGGGGKDTIQCG